MSAMSVADIIGGFRMAAYKVRKYVYNKSFKKIKLCGIIISVVNRKSSRTRNVSRKISQPYPRHIFITKQPDNTDSLASRGSFSTQFNALSKFHIQLDASMCESYGIAQVDIL